MQIVIDIHEDVYKTIIADKYAIYDKMYYSIKNGTPLPKGHGRLIDADAVLVEPFGNTYKDIDIAETIIEADKGSEV